MLRCSTNPSSFGPSSRWAQTSLHVPLGLITRTAAHKYDLRSLKLLTSGAAPLNAGVVDLAVKKLRSVGATVAINQGLSHPRSLNYLKSDALSQVTA